ncbi:MAG: hypothetical protein GXY83_28660 [Rhodopirellula sp.]|nr:hypothetical protein [Rhodopirellula sp.]
MPHRMNAPLNTREPMTIIHGEMANGDGEPYLADMVAATAAAVHGVLGIESTWDKLIVTLCLPPDWPRAEADVLYKGRRHHVTIENGKARIDALEQVLSPLLLWVMDFNLRHTAYASAETANVAFLGHYSDRITLAKGAASGTYRSPAFDWAVPAAILQELTVTADLNGDEISALIETSADGFKTVLSANEIAIRDGVNSYAPEIASGRAVRVCFDLLRRTATAESPVVDAFRVAANRAQEEPRQERTP